ncbi:MAG: hypothetical protein ACREQ8_10670, partial [Woeseiaceae bacterium]
MTGWGKGTLALLLSCGIAALATAEERDTKSIAAIRTDSPPRVDGRLDDPAWTQAAILDDLHMVV